MNQRASETYKHLILDVAEVKTFIKLYNAGKLPVDLIKEKVDEKIQQVIDMKFKMARGNDVKRSEEREVQRLFRKLVHIKDESAVVVPRPRDSIRSLCNFIDNVHLNSTRNRAN